MVDSQSFFVALIFTLWIIAIGASFGSFLNVIVWRMPRHIPIGGSRSYCPKCKNAILARDNIPVLGWLLLRGKCRNCQLPIAARYPIVEAAVALFWGILVLLEVILQGYNLPEQWLSKHFGDWLTTFPNNALFIFINHAILFYFLFGVFLIDLDQLRIPIKLTTIVWLIGFAVILFLPQSSLISPVPTTEASDWLATTSTGTALKILAGTSVGFFVGGLFADSKSRASAYRLITSPSTTMGIFIGTFLGWQAICAIALIACPLMLIRFSFSATKGNYFLPSLATQSLPLGIATIAYLLFWRWWDQCPYLPDQGTTFFPVAIILLAALSIRVFTDRFLFSKSVL